MSGAIAWAGIVMLAGVLGVAGSAHGYEQDPARVWLVNGRWHSTECVQAQGPQALQRKRAYLAAAQAMVRRRHGASLGGHERLQQGEHAEQIEEDVLGVLGHLEIVQENSKNI
ncbi:MAG: hypothetical protein IPH37_14165 [Burkholderiales bacterium]|nr:hypothetical protein [Burkholderiales bacterium]